MNRIPMILIVMGVVMLAIAYGLPQDKSTTPLTVLEIVGMFGIVFLVIGAIAALAKRFCPGRA